jgi:hypothetical protein
MDEATDHSMWYENAGEYVRVTVPWGSHTGLIPPPTLQFGDRVFAYYGENRPVEAKV